MSKRKGRPPGRHESNKGRKAAGEKRPDAGAAKRPRKSAGAGKRGGAVGAKRAETYTHPEADSAMRPEVGTQSQFRKKKPPQSYRYDSSLSPALDWDGQNPGRERGEALIRRVLEAKSLDEAKSAAAELKRMSRPFLDWAGKAERLSFDVPTLPLFVHERLSTKAILETLTKHKKDQQTDFLDLFGDPKHSIADQVLRSYEHRDRWVNRMVLGDSLVVMNSLLHYEGMGGQVQMVYIDPPYGVKFGSNFQPFIRVRGVEHNHDEDMTREPEMVQAYRDTWDLGLHSYLTYLRDRLLLARELLTQSGSVFVQISDENLHHVRELVDEVFGADNFASLITFQKTTGSTTKTIPTTSDYLLWYARDITTVKFRKLYQKQIAGAPGAIEYKRVELDNGEIQSISKYVEDGRLALPLGARVFATDSIVSKGGDDPDIELPWKGSLLRLSCKPNRHWKVGVGGTTKLWEKNRLLRQSGLRIYKRYLNDFPFRELVHVWTDTRGEDDPSYVVQTHTRVIERCMLMTTDPGDLTVDPTCGSGTTAFVAEQWGRRWITIDTSRVPLALARQRLLTATFPWYQLTDDSRGPAGGFVYKRKQNNKGEEVGGIVPHVTLKSIANDEPPAEEILVDRPETVNSITRVTGPFAFEATIPTPVDYEGDGEEDSGAPGDYGAFVDRMLEVLRKSPVLRLEGNRTVTLSNLRPPAKSLTLSAEAMVEAKPVAFVFGPENGAVSEKLVFNGAKEANAKNYTQLYVIGFAIQPNARELIEKSGEAMGIPATYVQATPDLLMGDLLKHMRSSQIFSVCGLPEVEVRPAKNKDKSDPERFEVTLAGLDVFDPVTMEVHHSKGDDVPCWLLDTDYNERCFRVAQAFFPRTSAWEALRRALKGDYEETVWDHLAGSTSAPFEAGDERRIAVKVIDDRGNELLVVKSLEGVR
ncbi:MAG: site-specific DNA-methyltransferase [Gemmatimonadaceae bacterium]